MQNHKLESYRTAISRSVFTEAWSFTNFSADEEIKQRITALRSNFPITINRSRKKTKIEVKSESKPAVSFKFAKLPDETESEDWRAEIDDDNGFAVPDAEPYNDLNLSRLFEIGNPPSFCIAMAKIETENEKWNPRNLNEKFQGLYSLSQYSVIALQRRFSSVLLKWN